MKNYVQPGKRLSTYNGSAVTVPAGMPIVVSAHIRVAIADILALSWGEAAASEVFNLPAKSADVWNDGEPLYWDAGNGYLTNSSSGNAVAGAAVGPKAAAITSAKVAIIDHDESALSAPTTTAGATTTQAPGTTTVGA